MYTVKGRIENGVVLPDEPLGHRDGEAVFITLMEIDEKQTLASIDEVVARLIAAGPSESINNPPKTHYLRSSRLYSMRNQSIPTSGIASGQKSRLR